MTAATQCDFLVVGAGIAGASIAFELARAGSRVALVEREDRPGYHTTGRSAALYAASYGNLLARRLTAASRTFFEAPPQGFCAHPLLAPRGVLYVAGPGQLEALEELRVEAEEGGAPVQLLDTEAMRARVPVLRAEAALGLLDTSSMDIDVHALHQGYLAGLRKAGGAIALNAGVIALSRRQGVWRAETRAGEFSAPVLVNAAGAWGDEVAALGGAAPLGLKPKRRTIVTFDAPEGLDISGWPLSVSADETVYFKPEAGRILASPADETDSPPCDAQPEELDIAITIDRLQALTTLSPRRITHKWAGLRTFAPDRSVVAGFDPAAEGFFWLVGQGGTGIQMAPALARAASALARGDDLPGDIAELGVTAADLSPARHKAGKGARS